MSERAMYYLHRVAVPVAATGTGLWTLDILRAGRCFSACGGLDGAGLPFCASVGLGELVRHLGEFPVGHLAAGLAVALATAAAQMPPRCRRGARRPRGAFSTAARDATMRAAGLRAS
jgi:hypothetical protein